MNQIENIKIIKNDIVELLLLIDNLEINVIDVNNTDKTHIAKYKTMIENIIFEYHNICAHTLK